MKIITKKEQIIPWMVVNIWTSQGDLDIARFIITPEKVDIQKSALHLQTLELVSYPERRQLTWERAKELVDVWPIDVYGINGYGLMLRANRMYFDTSFGMHDWSEGNELYLDPPHPEVEDVTPPWEVEKTEEDPWVEITPTTKVKLPCDALIRDYELGEWYESKLYEIDSSYKNPFKSNEMNWRFAKVRKSSIIEEPVQPTEPDDKIKRLWWYSSKYRHGGMTDFPMTEKEFIEDVLNCGYADKYAPGPIVPDESEWKEVK